MITLELRQFIIKLSFQAIKSAYGIQEKLKFEGYKDFSVNYYEGDYYDTSGIFYFKSEKGNYYRIEIKDDEIVSLKKGRIKVTF